MRAYLRSLWTRKYSCQVNKFRCNTSPLIAGPGENNTIYIIFNIIPMPMFFIALSCSLKFIICTPQLTTVVTLSTLPDCFAKHRVIRGHHQLSHLPAIKITQNLRKNLFKGIILKGSTKWTCSALSHFRCCLAQVPFGDLVFWELLLMSSRNLFASSRDNLPFELD